jgi:cation diffusion facilitator family transporter
MRSGTPPPLDATSNARQVRFVAWVGLLGNLLLSAIKAVAGMLGNSHAVVADAAHSLSDVVTDLALIFGSFLWSAPADANHPHGHRRIETLITVLIGLSLAGVALGLGYEAVLGLGSPHHSVPGTIALAAALLSIVCKEALYRWTLRVGRRLDSPALVANAWHHRSDALSSIPVALAVSVALIAPRWALVDRVGAVVVCVFILHAAWRIVRPAVAQLIDVGAPEHDRRALEALALAVPGVRAAHALRTRYTGSKLAVDLHVVVDGELSVADGYEVARLVRAQLLAKGPNVADVLVQVEPYKG